MELQANKTCPSFKDLEPTQKQHLANILAQKLGFGDEHIPLWLDGKYPSIERIILEISTQAGKPSSLLLSGTVGTGKTAYLSILVKQRFIAWSGFSRGKAYILPSAYATSCILLNHQEVIDIFNQQFEETIEHFEFDIDDIKNIPILMIDDMCNAKETEYNIGKLWDLIDYRWSRKLTTWITTNISGEELKVRPGYERIFSRLSDKSWIRYAQIKSEDRRKHTIRE